MFLGNVLIVLSLKKFSLLTVPYNALIKTIVSRLTETSLYFCRQEEERSCTDDKGTEETEAASSQEAADPSLVHHQAWGPCRGGDTVDLLTGRRGVAGRLGGAVHPLHAALPHPPPRRQGVLPRGLCSREQGGRPHAGLRSGAERRPCRTYGKGQVVPNIHLLRRPQVSNFIALVSCNFYFCYQQSKILHV